MDEGGKESEERVRERESEGVKSARVIGHLLLPGEEGNLHGMPWDAWENGEN